MVLSGRWPSRPPDFVGVGAQRAGTTWWYRLLCAHPGCAADPEAKELHYFDRFWAQGFVETDVGIYHVCFAADPAKLVGEWTPRYLFDPWTPPLLKIVAPDARILVLLRDPVERFQSAVRRSFREKSLLPHTLVAGDAFSRGMYGEQLARLYRSFEPNQVLVLQYERCVTNPAEQLARTYAFCGLDADFVPTAIEARAPQAREDELFVPPPTVEALASAYADDLCLLARLTPDLDFGLWPTAVRVGVA